MRMCRHLHCVSRLFPSPPDRCTLYIYICIYIHTSIYLSIYLSIHIYIYIHRHATGLPPVCNALTGSWGVCQPTHTHTHTHTSHDTDFEVRGACANGDRFQLYWHLTPAPYGVGSPGRKEKKEKRKKKKEKRNSKLYWHLTPAPRGVGSPGRENSQESIQLVPP